MLDLPQDDLDLESEGVQLDLDCANAFNEIDRAKVVEALARPGGHALAGERHPLPHWRSA